MDQLIIGKVQEGDEVDDSIRATLEEGTVIVNRSVGVDG